MSATEHDLLAAKALADALRAQARASRQRRAVVLAGERGWGWKAAQAMLDGQDDALWLSDHAPGGIDPVPMASAVKWLGRELDTVVIDAWAGFDADAFGAIAGTIRAGGLLILLTPPLDEWGDYADPEYARMAVYPYASAEVTGRFLRRLVKIIRVAQGVTCLEQGSPLPETAQTPSAMATEVVQSGVCRSADQGLAVEAVIKVVTGHRRRPTVLVSDRGRGKSSALGIAAAQLLQQGIKHIVVTGPRLDAVQPLFEQAARLLPEADVSRASLQYGEALIEFLPPDELSLSPVAAELVLVDEAAAIPGPLLERLLHHHSRIAFATTIHGYEGTGRGFAVRFQQVLNEQTPDWRKVELKTPIRWAGNDPVESFVFQALCLDAAPAGDTALSDATVPDCEIDWLERDRLLADEAELNELFGLLVLAHYRTTPGDLRNLLDGPNIAIAVMRYRGHIAATALLALEGGFDAAMSAQIWAGLRRPRGHLIPQSLAAHLGLEQAPQLRGWRVMRIAVHPAVQQRGLGSRLIAAIGEKAGENNLDFIGASFGATTELLAFWERNGLHPLRVGVSRDHSSGTYSAIVMRPLSEAGDACYALARERFRRQFIYQLQEPLQQMEAGLAGRLLATKRPANNELDGWERKELSLFAAGGRGYDFALPTLSQLTCAILSDASLSNRLSGPQRNVLLIKVLQRRGWGDTARLLGLDGKKQVLALLQGAVNTCLELLPDGCRKTTE